MTISSARPDALDDSGQGFRTGAARLDAVGRAVHTAATAYAHHCSEAPLTLVAPPRSDDLADRIRTLAGSLHRVAEAFRAADTGGTLAPLLPTADVARTTDRALSAAVTAHHATLAGELGGPTRAVAARGRDLGREVAALVPRQGAVAAVEHLLAHASGLDLGDPVFAAGVVNGIGADRLRMMTEELAGQSHAWNHRFGPLTSLSALWNTAARSLDLPHDAPRLDVGLLDLLVESASGRNVLRLLTAASDVSPGSAYLRRMREPLLDRSARLDASVAPVYLLLLGHDRQGSPDAGFVHALGREPDVALDWLLGAGGSALGAARSPDTDALEARVHHLLDLDRDQVAAASVLGAVLAHDRLGAGDRRRTAVLRATVAWIDQHGPSKVAEPLAQVLADTVTTDLDFFLGRLDSPGPELARAFEAIARFDRPWLTALGALQQHEAVAVADTLHTDVERRLAALRGTSRLGDHLEAAAATADRPDDHTAASFWLVNAGLDQAIRAAKLHPVAGLVARAVADRGVAAWRDAVVPDGGDRELATRLARASLQRRIWIVVADDAVLGPRIDWSVGGTGPDRHATTGSRITGVEDLVALRGTHADLDELAGWAAHQPADLQAMVATYLEGAE